MKLNNILFQITIFFSVFCYTKFFNLGTNSDIQIYYFLFSFVSLLLISKKKIPEGKLVTIFILVNIYILLFEKIRFFSYLKGIYSYVSMGIVTYTFYNFCFLIKLKKIERILKFYYWIWGITGIIQMLNKNFGVFWINRITYGGGRGSLAFSPEPAYYVFFLIMISLTLYTINIKNKVYFLCSLILALISAKSTVGSLYLVIINIIIFYKKRNLGRYLFFVIFILLVICSIIYINYERIDLRIIRIARGILENLKKFIEQDGSIQTRINHIYYSIKGSIESFFLPNGFSKWNDYMNFIFHRQNTKDVSNINTMFGAMLYELGGVITFFYYFRLKRILINKKFFLILLFLSLDGLNITNPLYGVFIGINYYIHILKRKES